MRPFSDRSTSRLPHSHRSQRHTQALELYMYGDFTCFVSNVIILDRISLRTTSKPTSIVTRSQLLECSRERVTVSCAASMSPPRTQAKYDRTLPETSTITYPSPASSISRAPVGGRCQASSWHPTMCSTLRHVSWAEQKTGREACELKSPRDSGHGAMGPWGRPTP